MPQLWATTTVPPALIPLKIQVIIHVSGVTRDTAATLASPLLLMRAVMSILMNMMDRQSRTLGKVRWRISRHENTVQGTCEKIVKEFGYRMLFHEEMASAGFFVQSIA